MATTNDGQGVLKKSKSPPPSSSTTAFPSSPPPPIAPTPSPSSATTKRTILTADDLYELVTSKLNDQDFVASNSKKTPPLATVALATVVAEHVVHSQSKIPYHHIFDGISMRVPDCSRSHENPEYHSIVGQTLLVVDWKKAYGLDVPCPNCNNPLQKCPRSPWSQNKVLFPIFGIDGPPKWAIVVSMKCTCCGEKFSSNDGRILCKLPAYAAASYPVEPKFAQGIRNCHIARTATELFDALMTTYGNGDLCSRLLYNAMNREYLSRVSSYYSYHKTHPTTSKIIEYPAKDEQYITVYPPSDSLIRKMFEEAWKFPNPWGVDDYLMWTREIQGVKCDGGIFAQDHTFDVLKNYSQRNGAAALWDVATDTGEVACAVLVRSTKTRDFAHAAEQLSRRLHFQPAAMYADTWPHKSTFWPILFGKDMQGRLGLFHFIQRITRTLRKNHIDYNLAINKLLQSVYPYHSEDYEQLLAALKDGSMTGEKVTSGEIKQMQKGKTFRQRYNQYHRKVIKPAETMRQCLDDWFCNFKVTASEGRPDPGGRLDPKTQQPLFTAETKEAVDNCKKNAEVIGDPLPIEKMYREVKANPRSLHQLSTWISRRPESKLESFHDSLSHFGNCGMGSTLCDSLNLCGTARYNLNIRHKLRLSQMSKAQRIKIPALWEEVVSYLNHCELAYVNALARDAGTDHVPFKDTEILVADTGERFFSKYLEEVPTQQEVLDWCQCHKCAANEIPLWHESAATSRKWEKTTMTAPPTAPLSPKQKENRQSFPVDAPLRQSNNPGQQLVPEQPQQQWHVKKLVQPPIQPNFTYIPHETITMWPTQGVTFQPMTWIPPQLPQQQMSLPPFPWMAPQQPQQQMYHACTVPKHKFCCSRYYLWYSNHNRKGRPPHEHQCRDRMQSKREMCLGQEQTSAKLKHLFSVCFSKELFLNFAATCTS